MEKSSLLSSVKSILEPQGILVGAIPLRECNVTRSYLLDKCGIQKDRGTAIMLAVPYILSDIARSNDYNVSLYAVARDYHIFFKELADGILPILRHDFPDSDFYVFADHSPIDERDAAVRAGLGIKGLNGLLLTEKYGSFVFLGEIITNAPIEASDFLLATVPLPTCEECGLCLSACPMGCTVDSRVECLSSLTQKKGDLTGGEKEILRSHSLVWGCDTCQLACPHNQKIIENNVNTEVEFFLDSLLPRIDEEIINNMSDKEFSDRAYSWRGRNTILRNVKLKKVDKKEDVC